MGTGAPRPRAGPDARWLHNGARGGCGLLQEGAPPYARPLSLPLSRGPGGEPAGSLGGRGSRDGDRGVRAGAPRPRPGAGQPGPPTPAPPRRRSPRSVAKFGPCQMAAHLRVCSPMRAVGAGMGRGRKPGGHAEAPKTHARPGPGPFGRRRAGSAPPQPPPRARLSRAHPRADPEPGRAGGGGPGGGGRAGRGGAGRVGRGEAVTATPGRHCPGSDTCQSPRGGLGRGRGGRGLRGDVTAESQPRGGRAGGGRGGRAGEGGPGPERVGGGRERNKLRAAHSLSPGHLGAVSNPDARSPFLGGKENSGSSLRAHPTRNPQSLGGSDPPSRPGARFSWRVFGARAAG